ncbi:hypothetical protein M1116_01645 [Patescibacteria group bacterium]|nr:hypothetical protein [Patescibacteria group bacterium]
MAVLDNLPDYPSNMTVNGQTFNFAFKNQKVGDIFTKLLPYIFVVAGLLMLLMLIIGGITLMTAGGDPAKTKDGYGKITAGVIGFLIIFVSFFVVQLLEVILGIKIL